MIEDFSRCAVDYPEPFRDCVAQLAGSAVRCLYILSPCLDRAVFDQRELARSVLALTRGGRETEVRILVADPRPLVERGHQLLELARKLPSKISIRVLAEHPQWKGQTLVLRDRDGSLLAPAEAGKVGIYSPDSRADALARIDWFNELWQHSEECTELRRLQL